MKLRSRLNVELATIAAGRIANLAGALASLKLLTVYLSVEEFGRFGLALAGANAIAMLLFSAYGAGMFRFTNPLVVSGQHERLRKLLITQLTRLSLAILLVSGIAITLLREIFPTSPWALIFLSIIAGVLLGLRLVSFNSIQAMRVRKTTALLQALSGLSRGLVAVPFVLLIAPVAEWVMTGVIVFLIALMAVQMAVVNRIVFAPALKAAHARIAATPGEESFGRFCRPLVLLFALTMVATYSDRFFTAKVLTLTDAAALVAFIQIARSVSIMSVGITIQFIYPIVFAGTDQPEAIRQGRYRQIWIAWLAVLGCVGVLALVVAMVAEPLVRLLTSEEYTPFAPLLPLLIMTLAVPQAARILEAQGMQSYDTSSYVVPKIAETVTMVVVLLLAVPWLGVYAVPLGYAASGLILSAGYLVVNQRV